MTLSTPKKGQTVPADWQDRFLRSLAQYANVRAAAKAARVSRNFVYDQRETDSAFATAWATALQEAVEGLEREAWRRAQAGVKRTKGVYHQGIHVADEVITEYSDTLLIFLLKAHAPAKYRDVTKHELSGAVMAVTVGAADLAQAAAFVTAWEATRFADHD